MMFFHQSKIAMADNPNERNLFRYDQTADTHFFSCRYCRNHVLSLNNCLGHEEDLNAMICKYPVNVSAADISSHWYLSNLPVVSVSCNVCNANLGQKIVNVPGSNRVVQAEGWFMLNLNRMVYWNGTQLVYADTNEPVFGN